MDFEQIGQTADGRILRIEPMRKGWIVTAGSHNAFPGPGFRTRDEAWHAAQDLIGA